MVSCTYKVQLMRLQAVLNASVRLLCSPDFGTRLASLMKEFGWLKFPDRIAFNMSCLTHRCLHGKRPSYLTDALHLATENSHKRKLRNSGSLSLLVPPTAHKTLGDRAWCVAGTTNLESHSATNKRHCEFPFFHESSES